MNPKDPAKLKEFIGKTFVESGEQYRLYNKTKSLLSECGWTERIQQICQEELLKHKDSISAQELTAIVYKRAQEIVPDSVKGEILKDVHGFVQKCCQ